MNSGREIKGKKKSDTEQHLRQSKSCWVTKEKSGRNKKKVAGPEAQNKRITY